MQETGGLGSCLTVNKPPVSRWHQYSNYSTVKEVAYTYMLMYRADGGIEMEKFVMVEKKMAAKVSTESMTAYQGQT